MALPHGGQIRERSGRVLHRNGIPRPRQQRDGTGGGFKLITYTSAALAFACFFLLDPAVPLVLAVLNGLGAVLEDARAVGARSRSLIDASTAVSAVAESGARAAAELHESMAAIKRD